MVFTVTAGQPFFELGVFMTNLLLFLFLTKSARNPEARYGRYSTPLQGTEEGSRGFSTPSGDSIYKTVE